MTVMPVERATPTLMYPARLTPRELARAAAPLHVGLTDEARKRVAGCQEYLMSCLRSGREVYGSTTGFGPLVSYGGCADPGDQCENLIGHLEVGQGPDLPPDVARAVMLARYWSLAQGRSGVAPAVLDALAAALATGISPAVPELGSLGASGDLAPLAHLARCLQGRGHAYLDGRRLPAQEALEAAGLRPLVLSGRDALGLLNGTSVTAAIAGLALARLASSLSAAVALTALLADMLGCADAFTAPDLADALGHRGTVRAAAMLRGRLAGLRPTGTRPLQEPYSIRCSPQLLGAVCTTLGHAEAVIQDDLNGVSDNPLFFPEHDVVAHGGNFFGQQVAFVSDALTLAAVQMANLAERQLDLMVDPARNGGLNPVLAEAPGRDHGVQGVQLAATAIVADMRRLAVPASVQSLPTNHHNQDIVPFGTQAALGALRQAASLRLVLGSLAVALRQAAHVGARTPTARHGRALLETLRAVIGPAGSGTPLHVMVRVAADVLHDERAQDPSPGSRVPGPAGDGAA
ncbi:aromatic amino acid ammonia-lyase [Streptomyces sp. TS71-3]|uniref:aromatic amino acid ammonia-lyase n=1 Tax=Streptomyces sp. TS71-3 TaxID=2733862 RepID=UPI001B287B92|nr:aromatic amino acid ammonia-lyase [Streptomyces sp. TS71-3]GHJ35662.1 histidine ammonia-lyase [Streptomyces sp. TS71-3]